jgi:putative serine protease PepD
MSEQSPWWSRPSDDDVWSAPRTTDAGPRTYADPQPGWGQQPMWQLPADEPPRRRRPRLPALIALVALVSALLGGGIGGLVGARVEQGNGARDKVVLGTATPGQPVARRADSVAGIAQKVLPSVVSIEVRNGSSGDTGSGVILSADGYILTNNHVVAPGEDGGRIRVQFSDKKTAPAKIVGLDPKSDLAVIKANGVSGLRKIELGSSTRLAVGDLVVAIGSPLGLSGTVTAGIVSAKDRPVQTGGDSGSQQAVIDAIQTDAAINPGNSGGALVDATGALVGINSAIATLGSALGGRSGNIGVGFAIPIDQARPIAAELIETGHATHPLLGVTLRPDPTSGETSTTIDGINNSGGARRAGLRAGDVIKKIDGVPVTTGSELVVEVRKHKAGDSVRVTFVRNGAQHVVPVTLGSDAGG